jgi:hypothetical protein
MKQKFRCLVCNLSRWEDLNRYDYTILDDFPEHSPIFTYLKLRRRVLFEIWFPGEKYH